MLSGHLLGRVQFGNIIEVDLSYLIVTYFHHTNLAESLYDIALNIGKES